MKTFASSMKKNGISGSQTTSIAMCGSSQIVYAVPREAFTTSKPVSLYRRILSVSTPQGGRVFDPFLGSGSSRIAAYSLGFDFVGCEIDKTYFELEEKRFETFFSQQSLFF